MEAPRSGPVCIGPMEESFTCFILFFPRISAYSCAFALYGNVRGVIDSCCFLGPGAYVQNETLLVLFKSCVRMNSVYSRIQLLCHDCQKDREMDIFFKKKKPLCLARGDN